jgi:peroxin-5
LIKFSAEFSDNYNKQFWDRLQDEWKKISDSDLIGTHPWIDQFSDYYDSYREYQFDENNPLIDIENAFEKGKMFMAAGDGPSAVLCFEAAVKQDPENAEIWELLGISQAENEKDPNAIAALKKSLELKPDNRKVLMALAVCYTNESIQNLAIKMLIKWLKCHPTYSHLVPPSMLVENGEELASSLIRGPELKETQDLFLKAVQMNAKENTIDPEIQEALGIAFNLSSEYDKAVDCFQAAISKTPDNARLWNRLGASYANGQRAVEAVAAYKKALEFEPGFVRARYNVGIICINMASYKEAVEHFLIALNHQNEAKIRSGISLEKMGQNQMSESIWSSLRMAISLMGKHELQKLIDDRNLTDLNKEFGI